MHVFLCPCFLCEWLKPHLLFRRWPEATSRMQKAGPWRALVLPAFCSRDDLTLAICSYTGRNLFFPLVVMLCAVGISTAFCWLLEAKNSVSKRHTRCCSLWSYTNCDANKGVVVPTNLLCFTFHCAMHTVELGIEPEDDKSLKTFILTAFFSYNN